jgi:hypothetical protein
VVRVFVERGLRTAARPEERGAVPRAAAAPPGRPEPTEEFAGEETAEDVMKEIREKEGG